MSWFERSGDQLVLRATGQAVCLFVVENFGFAHYPNNREMLKFLDVIAGSGANGVRVFGFFPFGRGREEEPYVRAGGKFDLNTLNVTFIDYLRQWVGYAEQRGIAVWYELFDSVGLKHAKLAPYHPFGEFGNGDLQAFGNLSNQNMVRYQKQYLSALVNVLKQFPNVIFGLMNEYMSDDNWHYEMSRYIKTLAPNHLLAGSAEGSPAVKDPNVDIWAIHTGSYDRDRCQANVATDVQRNRSDFSGKIMTYSTDGFGSKGMACEKPEPMRLLAQDVRKQNLSIFSFLDHYPYVDFDESGKEYPLGSWYSKDNVYELSLASRANVSTYQAIAQAFEPTRFAAAQAAVELPEGMLQAFDATYLESSHPNVLIEKGAKAVAATTTQGYLCRTPLIAGLPVKTLNAYVSVFIDTNTGDDELVLILDVYDSARKQVLAIQPLTRKKFLKAQEFFLVPLLFEPPSTTSAIEVRVYYFGYAYVAVNKLAIADPQVLQLREPGDIPELHSLTPSPPIVPEPHSNPTPAATTGVIDIFNVIDLHANHPEAFADRGGRAVRATTRSGFLAFGQYAKGYPVKPLEVYFSVLIDNNTAKTPRIINAEMAKEPTILSLDVYDSFQKKLLNSISMIRHQFPVANDWSLFKLAFTPVEQSALEFRIYYHGHAYIAADKIVVVEPDRLKIATHADLLALTKEVPNGDDGDDTWPPADALVAETLKDGHTAGSRNSASFVSGGLLLQGGQGFIGYTLSSLPRGFLEFSAKGFVQDELHGGSEYKGVLVTMWDANAGYNYETAPFIFELRKYGYIEGRADASNTLWFKIKSNGEWTENPRKILTWDPNQTYRFRLEWGGGTTRILRDGQETAKGVYRAEFAPVRHVIQIGANPARARTCPYDIVISNVVIGKL